MNYRVVLAWLLVAGASPLTGNEASPAPLTLETAFAELRAHHPALAAARANTEAARARIDQQNAWMDPRVTIEHMRDSTQLADYSELKIGIAQELPLSGRNTLRARVAAADTAIFSAQNRTRERLLLNDVRTTFIRLAAASERLAINQRLHVLLEQIVTLARQSYETNLLSQRDLLAVDSDLIRLEAERTDLEASQLQASARLNALLLRPADTPIPVLQLPEPAPPAFSVLDTVALARAASPEIATALRQSESAEARLALAQKNRAIDPELMLAARSMKGSGDVITSYDTGISFTIPWLNSTRTSAERIEARSLRAAARAESAAVEAETSGMVAATHARAAAAYEQVLRNRDKLVPLARASAAAAQRDYEAARAPLFPVLAAERSALEAEMKLADARAEQAMFAAELTFLTSQDLAP